MRAATCLNTHNAVSTECATDCEDALVFFGIGVVGDCHQVVPVTNGFAEHFKQRGFAGADGPANSYAQQRKIFGAVRNVMKKGDEVGDEVLMWS